MSSIVFPEKADIYAGNNSTALFAVEMYLNAEKEKREEEGGKVEKK